MKKRILVLTLLLSLLLGGCGGKPQAKQYTATFLTLFDTVTTITGKADSEAAFKEKAQAVHDQLLHYHRLFDIYHDYEGVNNLKTVNDQAGLSPVEVDRAVIDLLLDCKRYYEATDQRVNPAMGRVLNLWHVARTDGIDDPDHAYLPEREALEEAARHSNLENVVIDAEKSTVYLSDPEMRLDVGAVAKGWAAQRVSESAPKGLLISVGGNVCASGDKDETGTPWVVGVQDPDGGETYLHTLYVHGGTAVVTSGDYQRAYTVDGKLYHHIIDPDTLYPAQYWRSVTVVSADSGAADALSTALFLLPLEEGQAIAAQFGAEAMWVNAQGQRFYSPGFEAMIRT